MQKLSKRLQAVADMVTRGNTVADIGTDHGYIPIYLVQSGRAPSAVAMDINEGPLARAREHIAGNRLEQYITVRQSDGMAALKPGEAKSVIIAGMGGLLTIRILEAAADLLPDIPELVLEPQSDIAKVRRYLREHGRAIDREDLVFEDGKYYPVLHAVQKMPQSVDERLRELAQRLFKTLPDAGRVWQVLDQYGACLLADRHPCLGALLARDLRVKQEILSSLTANATPDTTLERQRELAMQAAEIRALQKQCYEGLIR